MPLALCLVINYINNNDFIQSDQTNPYNIITYDKTCTLLPVHLKHGV